MDRAAWAKGAVPAAGNGVVITRERSSDR